MGEDCPEQTVDLHLEQGTDRVVATKSIINPTPTAHLVPVGDFSFHSAFIIFHNVHALCITSPSAAWQKGQLSHWVDFTLGKFLCCLSSDALNPFFLYIAFVPEN